MQRDQSLDIAVTGIAGRFPGIADLPDASDSADLASWWSAVVAGRVLTTHLSRADLLESGVAPELVDDRDYVPARGLLTDADRFDNDFFQVTPRDAQMMDPQHRLMLETVWRALEDAAVAPDDDRRRTAVFASGSGTGYLRAMLSSGPLDPLALEQAIHGNDPDFIAGLISYKLGLTGPAIAVQTACSSGLVGVHLAAQSLLAGDCDQAVVVAAGIDFPQAGHLYVSGGIHSPSGRCRPFDASADGVVAGSGVACVVLRRLADALADGDDRYGVVLGSAVNNDGAAKVGYYAPSVDGQQAVIRAALRNADIDAASVGYLEMHGTGTRVGDPIEWTAAAEAYTDLGAEPGQIAVGALKATTGHLDAAAGLAALIKALFVVRTGTIPPVAGFTGLNPLLDTTNCPLTVPTAARSWADARPRRAGVSSFGIGGTNAHVVLEGVAGTRPTPAWPARARLLVLSADDDEALRRSADRLAAHLESAAASDAATALADAAHTLATRRSTRRRRRAVVAATVDDAVDQLRRAPSSRDCATGNAPLILAFPGQGSQRAGMARQLATTLPGFDAAFRDCLTAFEPDLAEQVRGAAYEPDFPPDELQQTVLAQPALFAVGYATATALRHLGLRPAALAGHSVGEITAACVAGVLTVPDAARVIARRGQAMQRCVPGAMLTVGADEDTVTAWVAEARKRVELAAVNGPDLCVLAGTVGEIDAFAGWLGDRCFTRRLRTNRAFHSRCMAPAAAEVEDVLRGVPLGRPSAILAANASGGLIEPDGAVPASLFADSVCRPVRFHDNLEALRTRLPGAVVLEVAPGQALSTLAEAHELPAVALAPGREENEVLAGLGLLWAGGQPVDVSGLCAEGSPTRLPGYPFRGPRWIAPEIVARVPGPGRPGTSDAVDTADTVGEPASGAPAAAGERRDSAAVLAAMWSDVLGHDDLGPSADFFELGGDSLLITQLARKVNTEFEIRVSLRDMVTARTLAKQTDIVRELVAASDATR